MKVCIWDKCFLSAIGGDGGVNQLLATSVPLNLLANISLKLNSHSCSELLPALILSLHCAYGVFFTALLIEWTK